MGINLYVGGLFLACQKLCEGYSFHLEMTESQENLALICPVFKNRQFCPKLSYSRLNSPIY